MIPLNGSGMKITTEEFKNGLTSKGAALVGVADLTGYVPFDLKKFTRGISIAIKLPDKIIDKIIIGPTKEYAQLYAERARAR